MNSVKKFINLRFLIIFLISLQIAANENPYFKIDETLIIGLDINEKVEAYLGVPYAEPPINNLRWTEPKNKKFNSSIYKAFDYKPACMQTARIANWYKGVAAGFGGDPSYIELPEISEDCLYLNIWKPKNKNQDIPVLVFIHGGSNKAGWSYEPNYNGSNLSQNGIIVISIAYRLGVFGFYSHPDLNESNFALLDIIHSLKWIKKHIHKIGGDPNNITISGESAGATNIAHLITSPLSINLFNKAIHQSAGSFISDHSIYDYSSSALSSSDKLSYELFGKFNTDTKLEELRDIDSETLLNVSDKVYPYFYPIVDGHSILIPVKESLLTGKFHNIDLIIGSNMDEELMYLDENYFFNDFLKERESWGMYTSVKNISNSVLDKTSDREKLNFLLTSREYTCPSFYIADQFNKYNRSVWVYSFDRVRDSIKSKEMGAYHGAELPYIFNTHDVWLPTSKIDIQLTDSIQNYWINFIKNNDPNNKMRKKWPQYIYGSYKALSFNNDIKYTENPSKSICKILNF